MILNSPRTRRTHPPGVASILRRIALVSVCTVLADARAGEEPREHWAYQPIRRPPLPGLEAGGDSVQNPIDRFVNARLESGSLRPRGEARREVLIRRLSIDLCGLPPTLEEVDTFMRDLRPDACERLVERLLASPRFGERWGRHWLDLVRYAESDGFKSDKVRPGAWRYRDYVIRAVNEDRAYDRFIHEQLAGDEIAPHDSDALVATGFLRHWPYEDNGRDLDRLWDSILTDVTDTTGQVFMGLTVGCARCHDHKFDAISQRDYYSLRAFFAAMVPRDDLPVASREELRDHYRKLEAWNEAVASLRGRMRAIERPYYQKAQRDKGKQFPPFVKEILSRPESERSIYERQLVHLAGGQLRVEPKQMMGKMPKEVRAQWESLQKELAKFDVLKPKAKPAGRGVRDIGPEAPPTRIPGLSESNSPEVQPGFLSVIESGPARITPPAGGSDSTGRRSALARWLTRRDHPLTARVAVNRLWQHYFGRGLVATSGDFGVRGRPPSHPLLLDWLASELMDSGWSLKHLHRLIVTSAAYRRTSRVAPGNELPSRDPDNRLLWRQNARRIEAEVVRDSILASSGALNLKMGGESVFPELPPGLSGRYGWKPTPDEGERRRRSVYLAVKRNMQLPLLKVFDVPDNHKTCSLRAETTTAPQALTLLNNDWIVERSRLFAERIRDEVGTDPGQQVVAAYRLALGRFPDDDELRLGLDFLGTHARAAGGLSDLCHVLWNTNEFMYVD